MLENACPWVELYKTWNTLQKGLSVSRVSLAAYLINRVVTQLGISVFTFLSLSALTRLYYTPLHALTCLKEKSSKSSKACRDWNQMHFWKQLCWKGKSTEKKLEALQSDTLYSLIYQCFHHKRMRTYSYRFPLNIRGNFDCVRSKSLQTRHTSKEVTIEQLLRHIKT